MKVPTKYSYRNLWVRKVTTVLTVGGIALVIFVFSAVLMLAHGVEKTLISTGSDGNFMILRRAVGSELMSAVRREQAHLIKTMPEIRTSDTNRLIVASEVVVVINLPKNTGALASVSVRGISPEALQLRPQIKLVEGKMLATGSAEIVIGRSVSERFQGCRLGQELTFGGRRWTIMGIFEAEGTAFESEIWGDVELIMTAFGRPAFSSLTLQLNRQGDYESFTTRFDNEPRLKQLVVKREKQYYSGRSQGFANFVRALGTVITLIFSFGAMVGATITMHASVARRTAEIGTLRALGFQRRNILIAFLIESILLSSLGGGVGLILASFLQAFTVSTLNFGTFSELEFGFALSPSVALSSMLFAVIMGALGGFLPAAKAARLNIVNALRAS